MADNSKFVPPKGMRDWLPQETLLRQKLIRLIEHHYQLYGFQPIDTPVMENIEVLQGKGGGENEKLMFKVMERGEGLSTKSENITSEEKIELLIKTIESTTPDLKDPKSDKWGLLVVKALVRKLLEELGNVADMGLRFDMTVPLARYYGNHTNDLPKPFRCYHIGPVWRADRPQKGRFREFYQCDIDIIGNTSSSCEVELLLATDRVLKSLGMGRFKIRISHKLFLSTWFKELGVPRELAPRVAIVFDKTDKTSLAELTKELNGLQLPPVVSEKVEKILLAAVNKDLSAAAQVSDEMELIRKEVASIQERVLEINPNANVIFDPFLVRGFDYYTGPVFEINVEDKDFAFSIGGGGRYDGLIEKLGGPKNTPAVGLSLGFERILTILMERGGISKALQSRVYIVNEKHSEKDIQVLAESLRAYGIAVETGLEKKDKIKQLVAAQGSGLEYAITDFVPGETTFTVRQLSNRQDTKMDKEELKAALQKLL